MDLATLIRSRLAYDSDTGIFVWLRKDGQGWRWVDSEDQCLPEEDFTDVEPPLPTLPASAIAQAEIDTLERGAMLPRVTREFLIAQFVALATSRGLTKEQLLNPQDAAYAPGFAKVVAFDNQIKALRAKL